MSNLSSLADKLVDLISDITYVPSPEQRKVKEGFWRRFSDNPLCDPAHVTLADVSRLIPNESRLDRWWKEPGFSAWFKNQEEFRERVNYLAQLALGTLEDILINPDEKGMAKVNASKLIMEVARKMPPRQVKEVYVDEKIGKMGRKELEEYIKRNTPKLVEAQDTFIEEIVTNNLDKERIDE